MDALVMIMAVVVMMALVMTAVSEFHAQRSCPQCGRILDKYNPAEATTCYCGWVWH